VRPSASFRLADERYHDSPNTASTGLSAFNA
jgi:hypothetical protein